MAMRTLPLGLWPHLEDRNMGSGSRNVCHGSVNQACPDVLYVPTKAKPSKEAGSSQC